MEKSFKEQRIRRITNMYYSRPEIQKAIYEFCKNREVSPRYFDGFGKRPDILEYPGDILQLVNKGATSFHCSEEIWEDPLKLDTEMVEREANNLRIGWDFLIDIDCKYFDYSKKAAQSVLQVFKDHGIKNYGLKFSGSKGFHIILPWKALPKEIAGEKTKDLFPELPRKILAYVGFKANPLLEAILPEDFYQQFKDVDIKKGIKCNNCGGVATEYQIIHLRCPKCHRREEKKIVVDSEDSKKIYKCPDCKTQFEVLESKNIYECKKCNISSKTNPNNFSRHVEVDLAELMGLDLIMVSPRHLFRTPYSLHEKTALASVVLSEEELENFDLKDADPMKIQIKNFLPDSKENEAEKLIREALDWAKENEISSGYSQSDSEKIKGKYADFKPIKLDNVQDEQFPPSIKKLLEGVSDGRKRGLFILINFFRSIGFPKEEMEKRIYDWNERNPVPLKKGYITSQLSWSYRRKPIMPPNFETDYYKAIGANPTSEELFAKNPVNYTIKKNLAKNKGKKSKAKETKNQT
jgi:hypothetical protein